MNDYQNVNFILGWLMGRWILLQMNERTEVSWLDEENGILYIKDAQTIKQDKMLQVS